MRGVFASKSHIVLLRQQETWVPIIANL